VCVYDHVVYVVCVCVVCVVCVYVFVCVCILYHRSYTPNMSVLYISLHTCFHLLSVY
jgi:hypothetical protein